MPLFNKDFYLRLLGGLSLLPILNSCQLGDPYQTPDVYLPQTWKTHYGEEQQQPIPENWKTESESNSQPCNEENPINEESAQSEAPYAAEQIFNQRLNIDIENWWEIFNDPILNELEQQAVTSNYSLWAAMERVTAAQALAGVTSSYRWPNISFDPSFSRSGMLIQNPISGGTGGMGNVKIGERSDSSSSFSSIQNPALNNLQAAQQQAKIPSLFRFVNTSITLPFNFAYEVDLWNRLTNAYYASKLRAEAAYDSYLSVLLTLTADVAANYYQLRGLDRQQALLNDTIRLRQEALDINQARFNAGLVVYTDVSRAQQQVATAKADYDDVVRQRVIQENILAILIGTTASTFSVPFNPLVDLPPSIPPGIPSELLYRRPDVAEAERIVAATYSDVRVAYAAFYPALRLTATLGLESPTLADLFTWKARLWAVGANVMQSVFTAGRNSANLEFYLSQYREAIDNYYGQVLVAVKDVEDSLINLKQRAQLSKNLNDAVKASAQTLELSRIRYLRGLVNYLDVSDAERDLLSSQLRADSILTLRYIDTILLIKALGGGWGIGENIKAYTTDEWGRFPCSEQ